MNKPAIKKFAVFARKKMIEDVKDRALEIGITEGRICNVENQKLDFYEENERQNLIERIKEYGYEKVMDEAAYTWFNRFISIRFMELNGYLPSNIRVLSSKTHEGTEPDIMNQYEHANLDLSREDLKKIHSMENNKSREKLYRFLIVKQCNKLNSILPGIFKKVKDYTEILLPQNLLSCDSVISRLVCDIPEEDFKNQVQIIGWLYQYYISEQKDKVFEKLKSNIKISKENIPAATQIFTPDWIVKYMLQNSLGRLWLQNHPNDELKSKWKYYMDEPVQSECVKNSIIHINESSRDLKPEDIKVLDPGMGSGHILVYAFDMLYEIYKSAGYDDANIPELILTKNLYGIEIDDRAEELAYFAIMMKARNKCRDIFDRNIGLNICYINESNGITGDIINYFSPAPENVRKLKDADLIEMDYKSNVHEFVEKSRLPLYYQMQYIVHVFYDASEYGSIINIEPLDFKAINDRLDEIINDNDMNLIKFGFKKEIVERIVPLVKQAEIMSQKYDVVCTNPPYMGIRGMNDTLFKYVSKNYPDSKADMFGVFMEVSKSKTKDGGYISIINQHSWMFLSSFKKLREMYMKECCIINLLHLGSKTFEESVGTIVQNSAMVARKCSIPGYKSVFINLTDFKNSQEKCDGFLNIISADNDEHMFVRDVSCFESIPGKPFAYWVCESAARAFKNSVKLGIIASPRQGMATSDNSRFLRYWYEVDFNKIGFNCSNVYDAAISKFKWFPYNKGGSYRKWFGNNEFVVNWEDGGREIKEYASSLYKSYTRTIKNIDYYFKEAITYTFISCDMGVRFSPAGFIFDVAGSSIFISGDDIYIVLSFLCSKISKMFLKMLNPTYNIQVGDIKNIPFKPINDDETKQKIVKISKENISICKCDWDMFESSWDFGGHPLIKFKGDNNTIEKAFSNWKRYADSQFKKLKENEEELNRIFIDDYGLNDEMTPDEDERDITIRKADRVREVKSFISYAVGCMFGRYSIDSEGLIYAGGDFHDKWKVKDGQCMVRKDDWCHARFIPVKDNIIPVTEGEYFQNDIVSMFVDFMKTVYGRDTLSSNLEYICESLNKKQNETPTQTLRRYFINSFYKDHVKLYGKRPIYWMFSSGKENGFKALVYMHRIDNSMLYKLKTYYVDKIQNMYEYNIKKFDSTDEHKKTDAMKKEMDKTKSKLNECIKYGEALSCAAVQKIDMDADDGVAVNYERFQKIEVKSDDIENKIDLLVRI